MAGMKVATIRSECASTSSERRWVTYAATRKLRRTAEKTSASSSAEGLLGEMGGAGTVPPGSAGQRVVDRQERAAHCVPLEVIHRVDGGREDLERALEQRHHMRVPRSLLVEAERRCDEVL